MNNQRPTPFDTGKVKIGVHYVRKQPQQDGGVFAEILQSALLDPPRPLIDRILHRLRVRHFTNV
jgi:hypothetical protein